MWKMKLHRLKTTMGPAASQLPQQRSCYLVAQIQDEMVYINYIFYLLKSKRKFRKSEYNYYISIESSEKRIVIVTCNLYFIYFHFNAMQLSNTHIPFIIFIRHRPLFNQTNATTQQLQNCSHIEHCNSCHHKRSIIFNLVETDIMKWRKKMVKSPQWQNIDQSNCNVYTLFFLSFFVFVSL